MQGTQVLVDKADIKKATAVQTELHNIKEGEILVAIDRFSVTTNNITYAATGDQLRYWQFFPTDVAGMGIVPVWGFSHVVESRCPDISKGERFYGYFPMASHLIMQPGRIRPGLLIDVSEHRADLPAVYNSYFRLGDSSSEHIDMDDRMALLQPLFVTSWLLADFLADNGWFGAEQVIIGSASSKTGIGLAQFLAEARPDGPEVIGLTSGGNKAFVEALGACDSVVTYDAIESSIEQTPSVFVDMAGNTDVRTALHKHLGNNMRYSAAVGTSHWDRFAPAGDLPGAKPQFFFAPSQIAKRREDWGNGVVQTRIDVGWRRLAAKSRDWLKIQHHDGLESAAAIYRHIADGGAFPDEGHIVVV